MKINVTKKIIAGLICAAVAVCVCGCSSGTATDSTASSTAESSSDTGSVSSAASAEEITDKILAEIEFPSKAKIEEDRREGFYEVEEDKIESYSAYICGSGAYPDELAVFCMKSSDDTAAVKEMLEKRVEKQTASFKDYTPDEMYKIDGNNVVVSGNYVALIICSDNAKATQIFKSLTK
ncbi:MAG: DUF4358 domain-containing protein [Ruminiclostridium sp.]|nr:DUF4358 domain-containing protein [Ruminiclostridium sp.]